MAKKSLGYVRLEWTCPNCGSRNPGPAKLCGRCGAPQPTDVEFHEAAENVLIEDEQEKAKAAQGPDIHCAYCGTRNPAGAETCSRCGGPLGEGQARQAGRVVGAFRAGPAPDVTCPACGAENPATALTCTQCGAALPRQRAPTPPPPKKPSKRPALHFGVIGCLGIVVLFAALMIFLSGGSREVTGHVMAVNWTRTVSVLGLVPVNREGWRADMPANAAVGSCTSRLYRTQSEPEPGAREVCGTPYMVDKGSGYAEVVQDCQYQIYRDWCAYTVQEWREVDKIVLEGSDLNPRWPGPQLAASQQLGEESELLRVVFETDGAEYTYRPKDAAEFAQFAVGSRWRLTLNRMGTVTGLSPAP